MRKACILVDRPYLEDRLFDAGNRSLNRDDCLSGFRMLREGLLRIGIDLHTQDLVKPAGADLVIANDMPEESDLIGCSAPKILLLFETEVIKPANWDPRRQQVFDAILTWDPRLLGKPGREKLNFPNHPPADFEEIARRDRESLCVMIAGNKESGHPLELYSERLKAIRWFEKKEPKSFDLYGRGWESPEPPRLVRSLRRRGLWPRTDGGSRPSWRGTVETKIKTLSKYKFSICYENVGNREGYITEKLFDCLFAGCVPVYWGAPDIADHVPRDCFIDRREFNDTAAVHGFISRMPEAVRGDYVEAGITFIKSSAFAPFSDSRFAAIVTDTARRLTGIGDLS